MKTLVKNGLVITFIHEGYHSIKMKYADVLIEDGAFLEPVWLQAMLVETRANGYGSRDSIEFRPQTASLAVPIMVAGSVAACVSMIWIRSALTLNEAVSRHLPALRELAGRIVDSAAHT